MRSRTSRLQGVSNPVDNSISGEEVLKENLSYMRFGSISTEASLHDSTIDLELLPQELGGWTNSTWEPQTTFQVETPHPEPFSRTIVRPSPSESRHRHQHLTKETLQENQTLRFTQAGKPLSQQWSSPCPQTMPSSFAGTMDQRKRLNAWEQMNQSQQQTCKSETPTFLRSGISKRRNGITTRRQSELIIPRQRLSYDLTFRRGSRLQEPSATIRSAIISALRSLYADSLRPTFTELKRRLQERRVSEHLLRDLPNMCRLMDKDLRVDIHSKEVFLLHEPPEFKGFTDPKDPTNPFECCIWKDFIDYVLRLMEMKCWNDEETRDVTGRIDQMMQAKPNGSSFGSSSYQNSDHLLHYQFEGGRYGMATKMRRDPRLKSKRLKELSLGQLCHLVQLSIAAGIMQYENNILQPRATCLRISAAFAQSDIEPERQATQREAIRDTVVLQQALKNILRNYSQGVLLSQLKCRFEAQLSSRLCQSVFGCTRLSNLLQLPTFENVCRLISDSQGRVIAQSIEFPMPPNTKILHQDEKDETQNKSEEEKDAFQIERCALCRNLVEQEYTHWHSLLPKPQNLNKKDHDVLGITLKSSSCLDNYPDAVRSAVLSVGCL